MLKIEIHSFLLRAANTFDRLLQTESFRKMALKSIPMCKGPSCRRIKWYISDNSLLYPRCHACSIEPSLVDNLLWKMQTPCLSSTTKRCKKGDGKMCLQVLQWQYKIFKIPKCLSKIKKAYHHVSTACWKKWAQKTGQMLQILKYLRIFCNHCANSGFCWAIHTVFRIWWQF